MKVILVADVKGKGKKGDVVNVPDGYAKNFLLPKKLAVEASNENMNILSGQKSSQQHKRDLEEAAAREAAAKMKDITVKVPAKGGASERLFGSVTSKEIAEELKKQFGIDIDKRKIVMNDPIRAYGNYQLDVKLYTDVNGKISVLVCEK